MRRSFLFFSLLLCAVNTVFSQRNENEINTFIKGADEKELLEMNSNLLMEGMFYFSDLVIDKLLILKPESSNYNYRKGFSTLEVYKDYQKAIPYFEKAIKSINNNYDMFSINENNAPSDAYFYLGKCYHLNEEIDKAEENYKKFKEFSRKKSELLPEVDLRLAQCIEARKHMQNPAKVFINNVGSEVNTQFPEYSAVISLDGTALYFTSRRPWPRKLSEDFKDHNYNLYPEDVYVSYQDYDRNWLEPLRLKFCAPGRNEATVGVSPDERKIFLYLDSTGNGDIYYSDFYKARFNEIHKLDVPGVNTEYWEAHAVISQDKSRFYFVSNRPQGYGGRDIYYCNNLGDDQWSEPINMGPNINTPYDEDSPFISIDNKVLYYSSNGPKSIGGFDIMRANLDQSGNWSPGENLGYPFNSTNDDIYYTTTVDGLKGYMTSFRKNGEGEKDIYEIHNEYLGLQNLTVFSGNITSSDGKEIDENLIIQVQVKCIDCDKNETRIIYPRPRDGFFISGLEPCKSYSVDYHSLRDTKTIYHDAFKTSCDTNYRVVKRNLIINPNGTLYKPVTELVFDENIKNFPNPEFIQYLGFNKNKLSAEEGDLNKYLKGIEKQLEEGREKITINIYASASTVPTETFKSNDLLAKKRAENIKANLQDYFNKTPYKNRVTINILSAMVQGPEYKGDSDNEEKYGPYQYVGLKTK